MISEIERPWRHIHIKFLDGSRNVYMQGPSQLSTPLYSQLILHIFAATTRLGGAAQTDFVPGSGKP